MYEVVVPLVVRDLTVADLPGLGEPPTKVVAMGKELERVPAGEADYLAVCGPSGLPIGFGAVDYMKPAGGATLNQLSVVEAFQSCGVGTILVRALEDRIRARGLPFAELGVDDARPRAQRLYERLGYVVSGSELGSWDEDAPDGSVRRYETTITLLRKQL
ncbi:GNAT family N-acetyltransferase [Kribbella soli]|uniref:GNAT family N-acetyltransferase n=1 Tax=Kribbella soli TaxID=1124743 RepID=A0A4R0HTN8_9ACTN|nr:GNAT family N-acetyltransferase [Kribbella soli]TCC11239.1 GNAT family N-acetyltransferase [Kribbella soli]